MELEKEAGWVGGMGEKAKKEIEISEASSGKGYKPFNFVYILNVTKINLKKKNNKVAAAAAVCVWYFFVLRPFHFEVIVVRFYFLIRSAYFFLRFILFSFRSLPSPSHFAFVLLLLLLLSS